jgi:guanylate kinase
MIDTKNIYLIVGQSGSGKSTIASELEKLYGYKQLISYTTRPPRFEGEDTHEFISDAEFDKLKDIVAYTEFDGKRYCATKDQIDVANTYVIDPKGVKNLRENYHGKPIKVVYIKTSVPERYERMKARLKDNGVDGKTAVDSALNRIVNDVAEFKDYEWNIADIDFALHNEEKTIEEAVNELHEYILRSEEEET